MELPPSLGWVRHLYATMAESSLFLPPATPDQSGGDAQEHGQGTSAATAVAVGDGNDGDENARGGKANVHTKRLASSSATDKTRFVKPSSSSRTVIATRSLSGVDIHLAKLAKYNLAAPLLSNSCVLAAKARQLFARDDFRGCLTLSKTLVESDPFADGVLPIYVCSLTQLDMKSELFFCAHRLVESQPQKALSWFAAGCYYYLIGKHEYARRLWAKAVSIDASFGPAWIVCGHSFAAQDETDQAQTNYRTAGRLLPGSHIPALCVGSEYLRSRNDTLATLFLEQARTACPTDPLVQHELGVAHYRAGSYAEAVDAFSHALQLTQHGSRAQSSNGSSNGSHGSNGRWEATHFNLGHALRKLGRYDDALRSYERSLALAPGRASVHAAMGLTMHLKGSLDDAIAQYHKVGSKKMLFQLSRCIHETSMLSCFEYM